MTEEVSESMFIGSLLGFIAAFVMTAICCLILASNLLDMASVKLETVVRNGELGVIERLNNPDGVTLAVLQKEMNTRNPRIVKISCTAPNVPTDLRNALTWEEINESDSRNFDNDVTNDVSIYAKSAVYTKGKYGAWRVVCAVKPIGTQKDYYEVVVIQLIKGVLTEGA